MNKINIALGVAFLALVVGFIGLYQPANPASFGAGASPTNCADNTCLTSLSVQGTMAISGTLSHTTTGTTTNIETSSSATQGFCQQFNATSSNTLLNITYAATSTTMTQASGVSGVIRYGACS